jgi:hypothetical protein
MTVTKTALILSLFSALAVIGWQVLPDTPQRAHETLTYAGVPYYTCHDKIRLVQRLEARGVDARMPRDELELRTYEGYLMAVDQLYLDPRCHEGQIAHGRVTAGIDDRMQHSVLEPLPSTVPPELVNFGKAGEAIFSKARAFGTPALQIARLLEDGRMDKMVGTRATYLLAKTEVFSTAGGGSSD